MQNIPYQRYCAVHLQRHFLFPCPFVRVIRPLIHVHIITAQCGAR